MIHQPWSSCQTRDLPFWKSPIGCKISRAAAVMILECSSVLLMADAPSPTIRTPCYLIPPRGSILQLCDFSFDLRRAFGVAASHRIEHQRPTKERQDQVKRAEDAEEMQKPV